jgi:hypothetical protein
MIDIILSATAFLNNRPAWFDGLANIGGVVALLILLYRSSQKCSVLLRNFRDWVALWSKGSALKLAETRVQSLWMYRHLWKNPAEMVCYVAAMVIAALGVNFGAVLFILMIYIDKRTGGAGLPDIVSAVILIVSVSFYDVWVYGRCANLSRRGSFEESLEKSLPRLLRRAGLGADEIDSWMMDRGLHHPHRGHGKPRHSGPATEKPVAAEAS